MKNRKTTKKRIITCVSYVVIGALAAGGIGYYLLKPDEYTTEKVNRQDIQAVVEADGLIKSNQVQAFYSDWPVGIENLPIKEGDLVKKGDILVSFHTQDLKLAVEELEYQEKINSLTYQGAAESNEKWKKQLNDASDHIAELKSDIDFLNGYHVSVEHDMEEDVTAEIDKLLGQIYDNQRDVADLRNDIEYDTDEDSNHRRERNDMADEEAEVAKLQSKMSALEHFRYSNNKREVLSEIENMIAKLQSELEAAETEWTTANSAMQSAGTISSMQQSAELTKTILEANSEKLEQAGNGYHAEFNGVVTELDCTSGAKVEKGDKLFELSSSDDICVQAEVSKYDIADVELGQTASVTLGDLTYEGNVSKIYGMASAGTSDKPKVIVEVRINHPDEKLYLGLKVHAVIDVDSANQVLSIPNHAVYVNDEESYCYVLEDGVVAKKVITTGLKDSSHTEVLEGLAEGAEVILDGITDDMIGKRGESL